MARIEVLEAWKNSNKLPTSDGIGDWNFGKTVLDMEIYVGILINDPSMRNSEGLWASLRLHSWLTRTTDQGRGIRRAAIMQPPKLLLNARSQQRQKAGKKRTWHSKKSTEKWNFQIR